MSAQDGGPAFPSGAKDWNGSAEPVNKGMSLRDYLAASCLQGMLSNAAICAGFDNLCHGDPLVVPAVIAHRAYVFADAMLKARSQ